jgi:hypothetical protein
MRRPYSGEEAMISKARCIPEGADVDATGTWHEGHASYPGTSAVLPLEAFEPRGVLPALQGVGMGRQIAAEAVVADQTAKG